MITLERHIETLLLRNDCVIIPHLGGFMTHYTEARYDEEDGIFLPPQRTLGFNPQLTINDSLLVLSYVDTYDISYPEALQRIEDEVAELKQRIQSDGCYELHDLGTLSLNDDGHYLFVPCEAGILTPWLYGLSSFDIKRQAQGKNAGKASEGNSEQAAKVVGMSAFHGNEPGFIEENEDGEDIIRLKFSWVRNTVAIAAVLLAIFLLALPTGQTEMMTRSISNLNNTILFGMMSKDTNTSKIDIKKSDTVAARPSTDTLRKAIPALSTIEGTRDSVARKYCIVLASRVSEENAQGYIESLNKKGFDSAEIYMHKNIRRVICGNFTKESEAYQALRKIHQLKGCEEAWVYKFN